MKKTNEKRTYICGRCKKEHWYTEKQYKQLEIEAKVKGFIIDDPRYMLTCDDCYKKHVVN